MALRRLLPLLLAVPIAVLAACGQKHPDLKTLLDGVVRIIGVDASGQRFIAGTGFVINEKGVVLTALSAIDGAKEIFVQPPGVDFTHLKPAQVAFRAPRPDVVGLRVKGLSQPPLMVAEVMPQSGADVFMLGIPGSECCSSVPPKARLEAGAMGRTLKLPRPAGGPPVQVFMHSATIRRGSQGGPVLDSCGAVVGLGSLGLDPTRTEGGGIFFATPSATIIGLLRSRGITFTGVGKPCRDY